MVLSPSKVLTGRQKSVEALTNRNRDVQIELMSYSDNRSQVPMMRPSTSCKRMRNAPMVSKSIPTMNPYNDSVPLRIKSASVSPQQAISHHRYRPQTTRHY